jgi:hypothetical protein
MGSMCFSAGTAVDTPLGPRPIEVVRPGDAVVSRDEATGAVRTERVLRTFVTPDQPLVEVRLRGSSPLRATPTHLFGTMDRGWVAASRLEAGEPVLAEGGGEVEVEGVTPLDVRDTVYNFEVEDTHTYFVGAAKAWVHNNGCDSAIPGGGSLPGSGGRGGSAGGGSSSGGPSTANPAKGTSLAQNLNQQLAIESAEADPKAGTELQITMTDPRWPASQGWVKMEQIFPTSTGRIIVHYVYNQNTGQSADFKIINRGQTRPPSPT